jgi:hypothetical protein
VILAVGASGCFSGLVDVDGLADTPRSDASPPSDAASSSDGGQDASESDAAEVDAADTDAADSDASPIDGSWPDVPQPDSQPEEAGDALEDPPETPDAGGWCETQGAGALFCDDFEEAVVWDEYIVSSKAQLELTTAFSSSPEHALEFHADALTQQGTGEGYRAKSMGAFGQEFTLSYELRVEQVPSAGGAAIASQLILRDSAGLELRLSILVDIPYDVSLEVESRPSGQQPSYSNYPLATALPTGHWAKVAYSVSPAPRKLSVRVDGSPAVTDLPLTMLDGSELEAEIRIGGCYVEAPSDPWTLLYDNVSFR